MYATAIMKKEGTRSIVAFRIANEDTGENIVVPYNVVKDKLEKGIVEINNLDINKTGITVIDMKPGIEGDNWYLETRKDGHVVKYYCIITSEYGGLVNYIADSPNGIINGENQTLSEIASKLKIRLDKLKLYNAVIKNGKSAVYLNGRWREINSIQADYIYDILGDKWVGDIELVGNNLITASTLKAKYLLDRAVIPNGINYIRKFKGNVAELTLPMTVSKLGVGCFEGRYDLEKLSICGHISDIPDRCFMDSGVRRVVFSGTEDRIGKEAFKNSSLELNLTCSARVIDDYAFENTRITMVRLSKTEELGSGVFSKCKRLKVVDLYSSKIENLFAGTFSGSKNIEEITLPKTIKSIGDRLFTGLDKLNKVNVPLGFVINKNNIPKGCKIEAYR